MIPHILAPRMDYALSHCFLFGTKGKHFSPNSLAFVSSFVFLFFLSMDWLYYCINEGVFLKHLLLWSIDHVKISHNIDFKSPIR